MIHTIRIRGFKRFENVEFRLLGHVVLAGPNNTGKTTVLQAIASWALALRRWRELNDFNSRQGYTRAPIARHAFSAVPLRSFDFLWKDRLYRERIEIELRHDAGWSVTMEFIPDSTEQIYVRPKIDASAETLRHLDLQTTFVPSITGLGIDEPLYYPPKIEQLLGLGRPGEVLRNLLAEVSSNEVAWKRIQSSIEKLFGYEILPPETGGAHIIAEYRVAGALDSEHPRFDIASAGSGFQQVLMLLAFLYTRPNAILLLDAPDAHLHVILQDVIYHELRTAAAQQRSQLFIATHSEVVINSAEPRELYALLEEPRRIADNLDRSRLISSLRVLSNADVMQAFDTQGILYVEGSTDIGILRAWAAQLGHRADRLLSTDAMWKPMVFQAQEGRLGISAREHFNALQLVRKDMPGLILIDGDAHTNIQDSAITGVGLQRLRWRRYEIESYLLHPDSLTRFVEFMVGIDFAKPHIDKLLAYWHDHFPPAVVREPLGNHEFLNNTKARTRLLPPLLEAAGIHDLPYTRYHEIAAQMLPEEIHPEVGEKLDAICRAFGVEP